MQRSTIATGWRLWPSPREAAFDVFVVVLLVVMLAALLWHAAARHGAGGLLLQCGCAAVLLFRRVYPLTVLGLMVLSTVALVGVGRWWPELLVSTVGDRRQGWLVLAVPFAAYSGLAYGRNRRWGWLMVGLITVIGSRPWEPSVALPVGVALVVILPALVGTYVANLTERAERAERDQLRLAEQARVDERVRLAAEMHDVVTHRVSLMVLQAGALGVTAADPATRAAAEDLRAAGCQALDELRDLVGVLRAAPDEGVEVAALPGAGGQAGPLSFAELVAESESVGVTVRLDQHGNPELASPVVARTAYRIVQEALTNVRKHAPGATATVTARFGPERVRLTVRSSAPERRRDEELTASGSGTGLLGLRQRVELVSGSLYAGRTEDGGFLVDASLPAYVPTRGESAGTHPEGGSGPQRPSRDRLPVRRTLAACQPLALRRIGRGIRGRLRGRTKGPAAGRAGRNV